MAAVTSCENTLYSEFIEYFCSTPSPSVLENWVFLFFEFWDPVLSFAVSGFFRTYLTFNFLARFHFSFSYSGV